MSFVSVARGKAIIIGLVAVAMTTAEPSQADWPRFLNRNIDGKVTPNDFDETIRWTGKPTLDWSISVGEGYGIGSVADDRYFHFDAVFADTASRPVGRPLPDRARLRSMDLRSGDVVWTRHHPQAYRDLYGYESGPRCSPTIDGDQILTMGVGGRLTCRQLSDGKELWAVETSKRYGVVQNFFGAAGSPLVLKDRVLCMVGGSPPEDQQIAPGRLDRVTPSGTGLVAFDRKNGEELWRSVDDLASYSSPKTIQIDGETLVLLFAREGLWCVDPTSGDVRWSKPHRADNLESVNAMTPVVEGNRIFISECYDVGSVLLEAGPDSVREVWRDPKENRRKQSMRCHWATPILHDGFLYGCSGRNGPDSDFRCIDWETGDVRYQDLRRERTTVTQVGDHLLVLEESGKLHVIRANPNRFDSVATFDLAEPDSWIGTASPGLTSPCWSAPVVAGNRVIVRGDRHVICLRFPQDFREN